MRTPVRTLIVVVCLSTVVACFFGRQPSAIVHSAGQVEIKAVDTRPIPLNARNHRLRVTPTTAGNQNQSPDVTVEAGPTSAVEDEGVPSTAPGVFEEFDRWIEGYLAAGSPADRTALEQDGESLALARRPALARLIESDPERAIQLAIPVRNRQQLPASIARHLEERVSALARFDVVAFSATPGQPQPEAAIKRFVTINDRTFKAFVYGRRLLQTSKEAIPLHGIAVGNALAVHPSPVRALEPGEVPDPSWPVANVGGRCPISKNAATPAVTVEVGGEVYHLCHAGHIEAFNQAVEAQEAGIGPVRRAFMTVPSTSDWTHGVKSVLFMRVNFPDDPEESISEAEAYDMMRQANDFFIENSCGATSLATTVTPLLTLPNPKTWYAASKDYSWSTLLTDARSAAAAEGFDTANFDLDCVHLKPVFSSSLALVGRKGAWLEDRRPSTACHELGHNYGLWHANAWKTSDGSVVGTGNNIEYGNAFDTMGSGIMEYWQFNACHKHILNWLPGDAVQTITSDGVYRLYPFDVPGLDGGLTYALKIRKDSQRDYWIETRQTLSINPAFSGSVLLYWSPWIGSDGGSQLLDTTPGSQSLFDAPLALGRSFYDPALGLKIMPRNPGGTTPESIDVVVQHVHYLVVEAESGTLTPPLSVIDDPLASQGRCISSPQADQGGAVFTVNIPDAGEYVIWCRVLREQPGAVAVSVMVDGESGDPNAVFEGAASRGWQWSRLAERPLQTTSGVAPKLFELTAGTHTVYLRGGGQNLMLDCLLFTDDSGTNMPPIVAHVADQETVTGTPAGPIAFTVEAIGIPQSTFRLTASSSNPRLVPDTNVVFGGGDLNRTVTVTPAPDQSGTASITLTVTDPEGNQVATTFALTVIGAVQALVNRALPGDTVIVPAGTYIDHVTIGKDISLQGAGAGETVIDANRAGVPLTITSNVIVTIRNLTLRNGNGGGLRNYGTAILDCCAVCNNQGSVNGGGIWNADTAWLVLQNCNVSSNWCSNSDGGGIYNAGTLTAYTITISGNRATGRDEKGNGGGIYNADTLAVHNSTIWGNRATINGGGIANPGTATLRSTIVAGNAAQKGEGSDCYGTLTSAGYNLIQATQGFILIGDTTENIIGQDPRLGPLQDNGGPTSTHALLPDSPAIDHGSSGGLTVDQRGVSRLLDVPGVANADDACDIGAYEWIPANVRDVRASINVGVNPRKLVVRIALEAHGDENNIEFSLIFPSSSLRNPRVTLGMDASDAALTVRGDPPGGGRLSVSVILPDGEAFSAGARDLVTIEFDSVPEITDSTVTGIEFDAATGTCAIHSAAGEELSTAYLVAPSSIQLQPRVAINRGSNGEVTVSLTGGLGYNWAIQASSDFVTWRTVATITNAMNTAEVTDPSANQYPILFYRAVAE